jgi:hypothetical protein
MLISRLFRLSCLGRGRRRTRWQRAPRYVILALPDVPRLQADNQDISDAAFEKLQAEMFGKKGKTKA